MSRNLSINTNEKAYVYIRFDNHNMFAISRIASKLNAVNNLVRKNLSNNNNNDNNDNNDNTNRWSSDLWSDSTPKSITNKLLKLLDSSGLKGKMQIRTLIGNACLILHIFLLKFPCSLMGP